MSDFQSLILYIVAFTLSVFLYHFYNKTNKKIFAILAFAIPMILGGMRYKVGTDYNNYYIIYKNGSTIDLGFSAISFISNKITGFTSLIFIYNFLTLLIMYISLNKMIKPSNRTLAYATYLFLFYPISFNATRQMLALSIVFLSLNFIKEKKIIPFIITIVIASLFHSTALVFIPLYLIANSKKEITKYISLLFIAIIALSYQNILLSLNSVQGIQHYSMYYQYQDGIAFSNIQFYIYFFEIIVFIYNYKNLIKYNKDSKILIYSFAIGTILTATGFINPYVKRIAYYYTISHIILLAYLPESTNKSKNKLAIYLISYAAIIVYFIASTYVLRQANLIPYNIIGA